jgi:hypothetical protein
MSQLEKNILITGFFAGLLASAIVAAFVLKMQEWHSERRANCASVGGLMVRTYDGHVCVKLERIDLK